ITRLVAVTYGRKPSAPSVQAPMTRITSAKSPGSCRAALTGGNRGLSTGLSKDTDGVALLLTIQLSSDRRFRASEPASLPTPEFPLAVDYRAPAGDVPAPGRRYPGDAISSRRRP